MTRRDDSDQAAFRRPPLRERICLFTLGTSPGIVPELLGALDPEGFRVFSQPVPEKGFRRGTVREVYVVTSDERRARESAALLRKWWRKRAVAADRRLHLVHVKGTGSLNDPEECDRMDEAILRWVLELRRRANTKNSELICCLAGGRKTMSATLQKAAALFGCDGLFHVLVPDEPKDTIQWFGRSDSWMKAELVPENLCANVKPVLLGTETGIEGLLRYLEGEVTGAEDGAAGSRHPKKVCSHTWKLPAGVTPLRGRLDEFVQSAARVGHSYVAEVIRGDATEIFPSLLRLRAETIKRLKDCRLGKKRSSDERELAWLRAVPKADLHCHLGGVLDAAGLLETVAAVEAQERERRKKGPPSLLDDPRVKRLSEQVRASDEPPQELAKAAENEHPRIPRWAWACAAVRAFESDPDELERRIYAKYEKDESFRGLQSPRNPGGLASYMALGDLQGSSLLSHRAALSAACRIAARRAEEDGVLYLELRCSPSNCVPKRRPTLRDSVEVVERMVAALDGFRLELENNFKRKWWWGLLTMATRHKREDSVEAAVREAIHLKKKELDARGVFGFDVAGDEAMRHPRCIREHALPLLELCVPMTVHAGEVTTAKQIWEAVYHLGAERIGHGLKLIDRPELMDRLRERRVAIEMCPSSNDQVVGFADRRFGKDDKFARHKYPLAAYLESGLRVTINTDNPGHSRTTLSREYLKAAWMSPKGLTAWDVLRIAYHGFASAFLPIEERQELLKEADRRVFELLQVGPFPWPAS